MGPNFNQQKGGKIVRRRAKKTTRPNFGRKVKRAVKSDSESFVINSQTKRRPSAFISYQCVWCLGSVWPQQHANIALVSQLL